MVLKFKNINYSDWNKSWRSSKQPRKQRKYLINAPIHVRRKIMCCILNEKIRELIGVRNIPIRVGDYVKILRGKFKNSEGFVIKVDSKRYRVYIDKAKYINKSGKEIYYPIHYSKIEILKLNLLDKHRIDILKRKAKNEKELSNVIKDFSVSEEDIKKAKELGRKI